jgi:hypothetical protein
MRAVGVVILKNILSRTLNYVEKITILKFRLDMSWEMEGVKGGLVALQSLSTLKRALALSISN